MKPRFYLIPTAAILFLIAGYVLIPPALPQSSEVPLYRKAVYLVPETLDPLKALSTAEQSIATLLYEGLFSVGDDLQVRPQLVKTVSLDKTGTIYSLELLAGITFHDGSPFSSADALATLQRVRNEESAVHESFKRILNVESLDAHNIRITLTKPYPLFTLLLATPYAKVTRPVSGSSYPFGTGPFKFLGLGRTSQGQRVLSLQANEKYRLTPFIKNLDVV